MKTTFKQWLIIALLTSLLASPFYFLIIQPMNRMDKQANHNSVMIAQAKIAYHLK